MPLDPHHDDRVPDKGISLRLIEPREPNQNTYPEPFNGQGRDERLNECWLLTPLHALIRIESRRCDYNEERLKRALAGMTPAKHVAQPGQKTQALDS